jgi:hypothetical protein
MNDHVNKLKPPRLDQCHVVALIQPSGLVVGERRVERRTERRQRIIKAGAQTPAAELQTEARRTCGPAPPAKVVTRARGL